MRRFAATVSLRGGYNRDGRMSNRLAQILKEVAELAPDERRMLMDRLRVDSESDASPRVAQSWASLRGVLPNGSDEEDAQAWVSRTRRESDQRADR